MQLLSLEQLRQLHTKRLYWLFRHVRALVDSLHVPDWSDEEPDIRLPAYKGYLRRIKTVILERPFIDFSKRAQARRRQQKLSDLRGNRNRPRNRQRRKAVTFRPEQCFAGWADQWRV